MKQKVKPDAALIVLEQLPLKAYVNATVRHGSEMLNHRCARSQQLATSIKTFKRVAIFYLSR